MKELLDKVIALSRYHAAKKNESVDAWFTRQLHERMQNRRLQRPQPNLPFVRLSRDTVSVTDEQWPLDRLVTFARLHDNQEPHGADEPLIVFSAEGRDYLIDGTKRLNRLEATGEVGPHPMLVVRPRT